MDLVVDPPAYLDSVHQRFDVVVGQDHPRRLLSHLATASHCDSDVGLLERRCVIDCVTSHRHDQSVFLHNSGEAQFVLRRHAAENMQLGQALPQLGIGDRPQVGATDRARAQTERLSDSLSGHRVVASDHPDINPSRQGGPNGTLGLRSQGIDDSGHAHEGKIASQRHGIVTHDLHLVGLDEARRECQHPQTAGSHSLICCINAGARLSDGHL